MTETETQPADVFVEMTDTLVTDFDVIDFLHALTERCGCWALAAAGLLLTDPRGVLYVVAASTERTAPAGGAVPDPDQPGPVSGMLPDRTAGLGRRLPRHRRPVARFAAAAGEVGFAAIHALPMRHRGPPSALSCRRRSSPGWTARDPPSAQSGTRPGPPRSCASRWSTSAPNTHDDIPRTGQDLPRSVTGPGPRAAMNPAALAPYRTGESCACRCSASAVAAASAPQAPRLCAMGGPAVGCRPSVEAPQEG